MLFYAFLVSLQLAADDYIRQSVDLIGQLGAGRCVWLLVVSLNDMLLDYEGTFAPVTTIHTLLAVALVHQWPLLEMDARTAFTVPSLWWFI